MTLQMMDDAERKSAPQSPGMNPPIVDPTNTPNHTPRRMSIGAVYLAPKGSRKSS